jgi:hypothetical protein
LVAPTTTREGLYVSASGGRDRNCLFVDTGFDPDPETGHKWAVAAATPDQVLKDVLANDGAELSAHEVMRRSHREGDVRANRESASSPWQVATVSPVRGEDSSNEPSLDT